MRIGGFAHQLEARNAQPLKRVGRAARLEGASAQKAAARGLHARGGLEDLLAVFNRARSGHDGDLLAANFDAVAKLDDRAFRTKARARPACRAS